MGDTNGRGNMQKIGKIIHSEKFYAHFTGNWTEESREKFKAVMIEYRELKRLGQLFDEKGGE